MNFSGNLLTFALFLRLADEGGLKAALKKEYDGTGIRKYSTGA